jgi:hypothetical protein
MIEQISFSEASKIESERVLKRFETRMMIAVEQARRDAIRNGRNELKTIQRDEQVAAIFGEVIAESSRAGLFWIVLDSGGSNPGSATERAKEHCKRASETAADWLASIVVRLVPGLRLRAGP